MITTILNWTAVILGIYVVFLYAADTDNWFGRFINGILIGDIAKKYSLREINEAWVNISEVKKNLNDYRTKLSELATSTGDIEVLKKEYSDKINEFSRLENKYETILREVGIYNESCKITAETELPLVVEEIKKVEEKLALFDKNSDGSNASKLERNRIKAELEDLRVRKRSCESAMQDSDEDEYLD